MLVSSAFRNDVVLMAVFTCSKESQVAHFVLKCENFSLLSILYITSFLLSVDRNILIFLFCTQICSPLNLSDSDSLDQFRVES